MRSILAAALLLASSSSAFAAAAKTYQVTGPVIAVTDDIVTVQKGKEKWEISKDASTKSTGTAKVGDKVTIEYRMSAATIEVKPGKGDAAAEKGDKAEGKGDKAAAKANAKADNAAAKIKGAVDDAKK